MQLALRPILAEMTDFYRTPRTPARFEQYLKMLYADTNKDLGLPIVGFNPMGKEHLLDKLSELQAVHAEEIVREEIDRFNAEYAATGSDRYTVVLNLADDVGGAWTNHHETDYAARFRLNPLMERRFCVPYLYASRSYTAAQLREEVVAAFRRTHYWTYHRKPRSLGDHIHQETYALRDHSALGDPREIELLLPEVAAFYHQHKAEDDHALIFNFLYGDEASAALGYRHYGVPRNGGLEYARRQSLRT